MKKKKIAVVTGSRADYGLFYWVMTEIKNNRTMELIPIVTGQHLSRNTGYTVNDILRDGFGKLIRIPIFKEDVSPSGIAESMGLGVQGFSKLFAKTKLDLILLLGDRFEMLAAALAAMPFNIPIGHIGGGEVSEGVIDDNIRHCLTKVSHLHFAINGVCADRIGRMGEEGWRIKTVGSPRLDFINNINFKSKDELRKKFGIAFRKKTLLSIFHPVTLEIKNIAKQVESVLKAIDAIDAEKILLYPNIDTHSDIIIKRIKRFAADRTDVKLFKNFERDDYLSILNSVDILVGNSSSGLIEGPCFKLPVVNIGNRQKGRDHTKNVIDVDCRQKDIIEAIKKGLYDKRFLKSLRNLKSPYGDGRASKRIIDILERLDLNRFSIMKKNCL